MCSVRGEGKGGREEDTHIPHLHPSHCPTHPILPIPPCPTRLPTECGAGEGSAEPNKGLDPTTQRS